MGCNQSAQKDFVSNSPTSPPVINDASKAAAVANLEAIAAANLKANVPAGLANAAHNHPILANAALNVVANAASAVTTGTVRLAFSLLSVIYCKYLCYRLFLLHWTIVLFPMTELEDSLLLLPRYMD